MNKTPPKNTWTTQHQDLYDALIAERVLPHFCRRISQEHTTIDRARARAWRIWAHHLTNDPGWIQVQSVLERPDAWPQTWQAVSQNGWSPQTDHLNALFFSSLIPDALTQNNFDHALYAFQEAIAAWNRALASSPTLADPETHPIYTLLDQHPFQLQDLEHLFNPNPDSTDPDPANTRKRANFVWKALKHIQSTPFCEALTPFLTQADTRVGYLLEHIYAHISELTHAFDVTHTTPEQFHKIFTQLADFHPRVSPPNTYFYPVYEFAVIQAVNTLAAELNPNDIDAFFDLLSPVTRLVSPFNDILFERIQSTPTIPADFQTACADFLILQGDLQTTASQRLIKFDQALTIAPEYPRAKTRAAQACLERANYLLLVTAPIPGFATQIPGGQRLLTRVEQARDLYFKALSLDPSNELLETYRTEITLECERFNIPFEPPTNPKTK